MKNLIIVILGSLVLGFLNTNSIMAKKDNTIKFNLLSPIVKSVSLAYEREVTNDLSLQTGFTFTNIKVTGAEYIGYSIVPEFRKYIEKTENRKLYFAPFVRYHYADINILTFDENNEIMEGSASYNSLGGGIIFGAKYLFKDRAVLDLFIGPSYSNGKLKIPEGEGAHFSHFDLATGFLSNINFRAGISIGIAL